MNGILGIDAGEGGGYAFVTSTGTLQFARPLSDNGLIDTVKTLKDYGVGIKVLIEDIVKFTGTIRTGASMIVYGQSWGRCTGILDALDMPYEKIVPQKWMKDLGLGRRAEHDSHYKWKKHLCDSAKFIYPERKEISMKTCDAVLIAYYGFKTSTRS
jgi:hypothetical protein